MNDVHCLSEQLLGTKRERCSGFVQKPITGRFGAICGEGR